MKYLPWFSLIISGIIVVNEISWIGKSDIAWLLIGLGTSIVFLAISQITGNKE